MWGVAAAAGVSGAAVAWRRFQAEAVAPQAHADFWALEVETPEGQPLGMAGFMGRPLLLNFWATWCPPCVEELPLLNAFYQSQKARGWQVLGLAVDQPSAVRRFLEKLPLDFPVGMAGLAGTDLSRSLGNVSGGLPYSVVFDPAGVVIHQKIGKVSAEDLQLWAQLG